MPNRINRHLIAVAAVLVLCASATAEVLTGPIVGQPESVGVFTWGDGLHNLFQQWSVAQVKTAGYAYGSLYTSSSNADVANAGEVNVHTIANAAAYAYSNVAVYFEEGDVVLFRGTNGYWGAWKILDVYPNPTGQFPYAYLNATWYFQSDGSASFVPQPDTSACAGLVMSGLRRRRLTEVHGR